jgi:hypothetical protein
VPCIWELSVLDIHDAVCLAVRHVWETACWFGGRATTETSGILKFGYKEYAS